MGQIALSELGDSLDRLEGKISIFRTDDRGTRKVLSTGDFRGIPKFNPEILPYLAILVGNPKDEFDIAELRDLNGDGGNYSGTMCSLMESQLAYMVVGGFMQKSVYGDNSKFRSLSLDRLSEYSVQIEN